ASLDVVSPRVFSRLAAARHQSNARSMAIDSSGRLLAAVSSEGVCFWDCSQGKSVTTFPDLDCYSVIFNPDGASLITSGLEGLFSWPLQMVSNATNQSIRLGRRQALEPGDHFKRASLSSDGHILAVANGDRGEATVLNLIETNKSALRLKHPRAAFADVSPDGRWVATGPFNASGVRIW